MTVGGSGTSGTVEYCGWVVGVAVGVAVDVGVGVAVGVAVGSSCCCWDCWGCSVGVAVGGSLCEGIVTVAYLDQALATPEAPTERTA